MNDRPIARLRASFGATQESQTGMFDRPAMLQFRFSDGRMLALAYSHLYRIELSRDDVVEIQFSSHIVTLVGESLAPLCHELTEMQTDYVEEADPLQAVPDGPRIAAITVRVTVEAEGA